MALLLELLLTAVVTLLAAFLLATFFAANDPRREPDRAAAAIAEEAVEEERIIEVDEVQLSETTPAEEAEGWVEVEKAPAVVVQEPQPECAPEPEEKGAAVKAALAVRPGAGLEEEADVGEKRCDLTAAAAVTAVLVEADTRAVVAEAVPREVMDAEGLESGRVQDVGGEQHDLGAEAAPSEVPDAQQEKQRVQVAQLLPIKLEAVETEQQHLVSEVSSSAEVHDAGLEEEESVHAIEARPDDLAAATAPEDIPDVVAEKKEEQTVEARGNELTTEAVPQATLSVTLAEKEEPEVQHPVEEAVDTHEEVQSKEEAVDTHEEVQNKEEAECETHPHPVDQPEVLVPEEELVATKTGDAEVSQDDSSSDSVVAELPVEVMTLQGLPEEDAEADMDFGEWEGIERSEVEKKFGAAAAFAASEAGVAALSKLNSDVQMQLQGLLKVAIDGPCYDSTQPLTLRPSSRAKWIAWQKLGNMHPEVAMEKYMNLLSEVIPGWLGNETLDTKKYETDDYSEATTLTMTAASDQQTNQRNEESSGIDEGHLTASPNPEKGQSSNLPAE